MSNDLKDQFSDDQDAFWQSMGDRHLATSYYEPVQPVDQSATRFYQPAMRDWHLPTSYYEPAQPVDQSATKFYQPAQSIVRSDVIPPAIAVCWFLLCQSRLSEETFNLLVSAASGRVTRFAEGLDPLDARSLAIFLHFWIAVRILSAEPEIVISPKGNIQAEWTKDENDFLVLEFQPSGEILFSLWQDGYPTEGMKSAKRAQELVNMLGAMDENPLSWSDAA